jgi:hypothetical protein
MCCYGSRSSNKQPRVADLLPGAAEASHASTLLFRKATHPTLTGLIISTKGKQKSDYDKRGFCRLFDQKKKTFVEAPCIACA